MMTKAKLSAWMPGSVKPWEPGCYEVRCVYGRFGPKGIRSLVFEGSFWTFAGGDCGFGASCDSWRGLAQDPKGKKPEIRNEL